MWIKTKIWQRNKMFDKCRLIEMGYIFNVKWNWGNFHQMVEWKNGTVRLYFCALLNLILQYLKKGDWNIDFIFISEIILKIGFIEIESAHPFGASLKLVFR